MALLPILKALAGPAASLAGSWFGGKSADKGQKAANESNERIAKENRVFQERMSSTAYQRSAKDLTAAGLNRVLALGSPSSSPSGAVATMKSETAGKADALKTGTSSALQARIAQGQFEQIKAGTANIGAQTNKTNLEADNVSAHNAKLRAEEAIYEKHPWARAAEMLLPFLGTGAVGAGVGYLSGRLPTKTLTNTGKPTKYNDRKSRSGKGEVGMGPHRAAMKRLKERSNRSNYPQDN